MINRTEPKTPGRPAIGKQRVQLTLRPDIDSLLDDLAKEMQEDRSTIVKEAILKFAESFYMRQWRQWGTSHPAETTYFRFSRTITSTTQTGPDPIIAPLHLLIKVDKKASEPKSDPKVARQRAMDFMNGDIFWGDIKPNPALLIQISEREARKANIFQPISTHHDGTIYNVEWP